LLLRYPQRKKYCNLGHSFQRILKCRRNILWVRTESLFLKYVSTAKAGCSTDQRSMATEMLWVSLEERSRTNSLHQPFTHSCFAKSSGISARPCIEINLKDTGYIHADWLASSNVVGNLWVLKGQEI
jgi:hypothetical protein